MSYLLRHAGAEAGLSLDTQGFVRLDALCHALATYAPTKQYTRHEVEQLIESEPPEHRRFERLGAFVRARYGHSRDVRAIHYTPKIPPETLFHGTVEDILPAIRRDGLLPMGRQFVHLSVSEERARIVALRRTSSPCILAIRALDAHNAGVVFFHPEAEHFLVKELPPEWVEFPVVV
ncbi:MAG: RNA--NAD 2'-phosphotransferase [Deltaproteobacteria bacterium]|nr:RNA--NAD 2'-phosphotransferase [Deltaproteobacteria bacterium]MBU50084.1 RNA--NAD 2'-phosphotransferase [Deltaproteobacteria bacterium]|tara:strand:+ start:11299 stop:11829 length:531 start_codon:yes stop_codon:yes gene_type:complete